MSRVGAALVGAAAMLSGCTFHNTLYNAERLYLEAERLRYAGRDSLARARYQDVIRKTTDAYRGRPDDERAASVLFLLGRAQLRTGQLHAARSALTEAEANAHSQGLTSEIGVYLAITEARLGEEEGALRRVEDALTDTTVAGAVRAEALLLRGTLRLGQRSAATAWVDLDEAGRVLGVDVEAGLTRLASSLRYGERERAAAAVAVLLSTPGAGERLDSIVRLVRVAAERWGADAAADLLQGVESSRWEQLARGRIRLERARLRRESSDTLAAVEDVGGVASARGDVGAEARLLLADWRLAGARDLGAAASIRPVLLPVAGHPRADALLEALDELERHAGMGLDQPLAWFVAGEIARDRLQAPVIARGFFLAYADIDPSAPWAAKALLAALDVSVEEADRAWLRGRLEAHRDSPYVLAAWGRSPAGFDALDEELDVRLRAIRGG